MFSLTRPVVFDPASILLRAELDDPQGMKAEGPRAQQGESSGGKWQSWDRCAGGWADPRAHPPPPHPTLQPLSEARAQARCLHGALPRVFRESSFAKSQTRNWAPGWVTTRTPGTERYAASACAGEDILPPCPPAEPGPPEALSTGIVSQLLSNVPFLAFAHKRSETLPWELL